MYINIVELPNAFYEKQNNIIKTNKIRVKQSCFF